MQFVSLLVVFPIISCVNVDNTPHGKTQSRSLGYIDFSPNFPPAYALYQKQFLQWKTLSSSFPQVSNWGMYVSSFSSGDCLTFLDNFANIDLHESILPVLIRRPQPAFRGDKIFWTLLRIEKNNSTNRFKKCTSGYFLPWSAASNIRDTCLRLSMRSFVSQSKPWRCQVKFDIFPPLHMYDTLNGSPATFLNNFNENSFMQSTTPSLYGIVKPGQWAQLSGWFTYNWISNTFESKIIGNKLFVIVTIILSNNVPFESKATPYSVAVIKLCPGCFATAMEFLNTRLETQYLIESLNASKLILSEGYPSASDVLEVALIRPENNIIFDHFMTNLLECKKVPSIKFLDSSITDNVADKVGKKFGAMWDSILSNYSIIASKTYLGGSVLESCKKRQKVKFKSFRDCFETLLQGITYPTSYYFPLTPIQDPFNTVRFVSCGSSRKLMTLQFSELWAPFDSSTWVTILASFVAMTIASSPARTTSIADHVINLTSFLKAMLEQGNPFPEHALVTKKSKILNAGFLLIGIVLSSAYKNTNVYRMILPRFPIPFEYFRELVENNFTVYTGATSVDIFSTKSRETRFCAGEKIYTQNKLRLYCLKMAVDSVTVMEENFGKYFQMLDMQSDSNTSDFVNRQVAEISINRLGVVNRSMFHPEFLRRLKNSTADSNTDGKNQEAYLYSALKTCNNIALVIPEHMGRYHYRKLRREVPQAQVDLGKEVYSNFNWLFSLQGIVPPHVSKSIKNVRPSGIWEWSVKVSTNYDSSRDKNQVAIAPRAANMHGNIVIIFVVWFVGLAVSTTWFLVERLAGIVCVVGGYCTYRFLHLIMILHTG